MSESLLLGAILATVGGFLDAHTYICRGKVFANAETGNIVLNIVQSVSIVFVGLAILPYPDNGICLRRFLRRGD